MKRYVIAENLSKFIIFKKTFWGWKCLRQPGDKYLCFDTLEAAEKYLKKKHMLHGLYPIVKEVYYY